MKTPWFSFNTPPTRVGVYQVLVSRSENVHYSHWNGVFWELTNCTPEEAEHHRGTRSIRIGYAPHSYSGWRGFMSEQ